MDLSCGSDCRTVQNISIKVNRHKKRGFKVKAHSIWKFLDCVYGLNGEWGKVNSKLVYGLFLQVQAFYRLDANDLP
jgi:hypothetical protein